MNFLTPHPSLIEINLLIQRLSKEMRGKGLRFNLNTYLLD